MTAPMSTRQPSTRTPYSAAVRTSWAISALRMRALLGMQPRMGQVPPTPVPLDHGDARLGLDARAAAFMPAMPAPITIRLTSPTAPNPTAPPAPRSDPPPAHRRAGWTVGRPSGYRVLTTERRWSYCIVTVEVAVARGVPPMRSCSEGESQTRPSSQTSSATGARDRRTRRPGPFCFCAAPAPPSSSGPGHRPFKAAARVRIPLGASCRRPNFRAKRRAQRRSRVLGTVTDRQPRTTRVLASRPPACGRGLNVRRGFWRIGRK